MHFLQSSCDVCVQLFSGVFADDPLFVCEVAQTVASSVDQSGSKKSQKDRQLATLTSVGQVLDVITLRHRLIDAAWETETLSKVSFLLSNFTIIYARFIIVD